MQQRPSDDFRAQIKFWGMTPSYAFVAEPQTNGVAERFNRTMKEQAIHGRLFKNAKEVRAAAVAFKNRYNREWRLEKTGLQVTPRSPSGSALATCRLIAKSCLNNRIRYIYIYIYIYIYFYFKLQLQTDPEPTLISSLGPVP
ncbi:MAG: integrase core domain-containing protein [Burkholderia sp.]